MTSTRSGPRPPLEMTSWLLPAVALFLHVVGVLCLAAGDRAVGVRGAVVGLAGTGLLVLHLFDRRRTRRARVRLTPRGILAVGAVLAVFYVGAAFAGA